MTMRSFSDAERAPPETCTTRSEGPFVIGPNVRAVRNQRESCDCETPTSFESDMAVIALGGDSRCTIFALKLSV